MFDQNPQTNQNPNPNSVVPQAPQNLPFGAPQSPFMPPPPPPAASVNNAPPVYTPQPQQPVEDMFSATEKPTTMGGYASQRSGMPAYTPGPEISQAELFGGGGGIPWGRVITIVLVLLVVIGGAGATIYYFLFMAKPSAVEPVNNTTSTQAQTPATNIPIVNAETTTPPETAPVMSEVNKDSDGDGLIDTEEKSIGTDPLKADSDLDGLTDWAEVTIYKSDPLNADTDGDGYKDGAEVINNYDPTKPGSARLYEVPKATTTK